MALAHIPYMSRLIGKNPFIPKVVLQEKTLLPIVHAHVYCCYTITVYRGELEIRTKGV